MIPTSIEILLSCERRSVRSSHLNVSFLLTVKLNRVLQKGESVLIRVHIKHMGVMQMRRELRWPD